MSFFKCVIFLSFLSQPLSAWSQLGVNPSQFNPSQFKSSILALPSNFEAVSSAKSAEQNYNFVTSSLKKVNGQWRYAKSSPITGHVESDTYLIETLSVHTLATSITLTANSQGLVSVFECKTLACGRSYGWAIEVYDNKILHGKDTHQYYWLWEYQNSWFSIYLTEPSNGRVYLQFIHVSNSPQEHASKNTAKWDEQGYASIEMPFNDSDLNIINELIGWLSSKGATNIAVVGYDYSSNLTPTQKRQQSLSNAEVILTKLQSQFTGVAYGFGNLVVGREATQAGNASWAEVIIE